MVDKHHKQLCRYNDKYCVLVPVWYDNELTPAWRKWFVGSKSECKAAFDGCPDHLIASYEENKQAREWKLKEMMFCRSIGHNKKADSIAAQYGF